MCIVQLHIVWQVSIGLDFEALLLKHAVFLYFKNVGLETVTLESKPGFVSELLLLSLLWLNAEKQKKV